MQRLSEIRKIAFARTAIIETDVRNNGPENLLRRRLTSTENIVILQRDRIDNFNCAGQRTLFVSRCFNAVEIRESPYHSPYAKHRFVVIQLLMALNLFASLFSLFATLDFHLTSSNTTDRCIFAWFHRSCGYRELRESQKIVEGFKFIVRREITALLAVFSYCNLKTTSNPFYYRWGNNYPSTKM